MYLGSKRGVGDVVSVPMSDWGLISPCQIAAVNTGTVAAASTSGGNSALGTWGWLIALGIVIYATAGKGNQ